ncbi:MAG TPA: helix-turn-helix domain-containing protein [Candidatus Saccharimonadales bacterium]|nr:helix-turn-helix domain-containing protein [Candidatus Saccharimonadales bacterium]
MPRHIRRASLVKALQTTSATMTRWEKEGLFQAVTTINNESHYDVTAINERLALAARVGNITGRPPVYDDLVGGTYFVKTPVVAQDLGVTVTHVDWLINHGKLEAFRLANEFLVLCTSLERYKASVNRDLFLLRSDVQKVLGVGRTTVDALVKEGRMHYVSGDRRRRIPRGSLARYLHSPNALPQWIDPEYWIDFRLTSTQPLLFMYDAAPQVGGIDELQALMKSRKIWYITHPGGQKRLIPSESIQQYVRQLPVMPHGNIAQLFGTDPHTVERWFREAKLGCTLHRHIDLSRHLPCILAILERHLTPGVSVQKWFRARKEGRTPLLSPEKVGGMLGMSELQVLDEANAGLLRGLCNPDGIWSFSEAYIEHLRHERRSR